MRLLRGFGLGRGVGEDQPRRGRRWTQTLRRMWASLSVSVAMKHRLPFMIIAAVVSTMCSQIANAQSTKQLIVTLETPEDAVPELFCVIGSQKCNGSRCH